MIVLYPQTEQAQEQIGGALAQVCTGEGLIFLKGDLGAGKTTFARGFLRGMGHVGSVKSPTYTLIESYEVNGNHCYHLDLYRLGDPDELEFLGIRDLLEEGTALLVEWPEQGGDALPVADLLVTIRYQSEGRELSIEAKSARGVHWLDELKDQLEV